MPLFNLRILGVGALAISTLVCSAAVADWPDKGSYTFDDWAGPPIGVFTSIPTGAAQDWPILIVIPGARRNAEEYRDQWHHLATANQFLVLVLQGPRDSFPSEWEYNAGGVVNESGASQPEERWLFSVIEPMFDDFTRRFSSTRTRYSLYGHSAGGGFVHRFLLFKPGARVDRAVAANPAFWTMPDASDNYPFGVRNTKFDDQDIATWFSKPLTILLGEKDLGPRTKPLSNGPRARVQGPNVLTRGVGFYKRAAEVATDRQLPLRWQLDVVPNVGHSNAHLASHAVRHLFP